MRTRTLIGGGPRTGKTMLAIDLAAESGAPLRHTDDLVGVVDFVGSASVVAEWFSAPAPWVIEGVTVVRALRAWLRDHPAPEKPADVVVWLSRPKTDRTPRQVAMAAGIETVWNQVAEELASRGVHIDFRDGGTAPLVANT